MRDPDLLLTHDQGKDRVDCKVCRSCILAFIMKNKLMSAFHSDVTWDYLF